MDANKQHREQSLPAHVVKSCFGPGGCPNAILAGQNLAARLEAACSDSKLEPFLKRRFGTPLKRHHQFRITIAHCPNACSQPQIVDIGIIAAAVVSIDPDAPCSQCEACLSACREKGIELSENGPLLDFKRCLMCGHCAQACTTGSLMVLQQAYRVQLGGRLGRRPRLARELDRTLTGQEVLEIVEASLAHFMTHSGPGERFGDLLCRMPLPGVTYAN